MEQISWTERVRKEEVLRSRGGVEYRTYNRKKVGELDWSHLG
jgi:hypothetical protein